MDPADPIKRGPAVWARRTLAFVLLAVLISANARINGFIPLEGVKSLGIEYYSLGTTASFIESGPTLEARSYGLPSGAPVLFGAPYHWIAGALGHVFHLSALQANNTAAILFLVLSWISFSWTLRRFPVPMTVAVFAPFVFYTQSFIWGHANYGALQVSFICIPLYLSLDIALSQTLCKPTATPLGRILAYLIGLSALRTLALFMDGYSFVITVAASLVLTAFSLSDMIRNRRSALRFAVLGAWLATSIPAYFLYKAYLPASAADGAFEPMRADFFRAFGVDLVTLVRPNPAVLGWASFLNVGRTPNFNDYFSDGSSVSFNYLGYSMIACFAVSVARFRRNSQVVHALLAAAALSFVLSLGPSLKIDNKRSDFEREHSTTSTPGPFMPKEAAAMYLGTDDFYTRTPGLQNMRAVYRWLVFPKTVLVFTLALACGSLWATGRRIAASILFLCAVFEQLPSFRERNSTLERNRAQLEQFDADVIVPLAEFVGRGDRIAFCGPDLDYMAPYIAGRLGARTYNAGSDKTLAIVWHQWSKPMQNIKMQNRPVENANTMMLRGELDHLVIPFFNLRWDSYKWPPAAHSRQALVDQAETLIAQSDSQLLARTSKYFILVSRPTTQKAEISSPDDQED